MTITLFRRLPHGHPLPKGWKLADQSISHHTHYAVLIVREAESVPITSGLWISFVHNFFTFSSRSSCIG
jgi:hypothetical protein